MSGYVAVQSTFLSGLLAGLITRCKTACVIHCGVSDLASGVYIILNAAKLHWYFYKYTVIHIELSVHVRMTQPYDYCA